MSGMGGGRPGSNSLFGDPTKRRMRRKSHEVKGWAVKPDIEFLANEVLKLHAKVHELEQKLEEARMPGERESYNLSEL